MLVGLLRRFSDRADKIRETGDSYGIDYDYEHEHDYEDNSSR